MFNVSIIEGEKITHKANAYLKLLLLLLFYLFEREEKEKVPIY